MRVHVTIERIGGGEGEEWETGFKNRPQASSREPHRFSSSRLEELAANRPCQAAGSLEAKWL